MLGWMIIVRMEMPDEDEHDAVSDSEIDELAYWEVGRGGVDWLRCLVKAGKATFQWYGGGGRYMVLASDVLPLIAEGPPLHVGPAVNTKGYNVPANWIGTVILHRDRILSCPNEQKLFVDTSEITDCPCDNDECDGDEIDEVFVGWQVTIRKSDEDDPATGKLAQWEVGIGGTDWLESLVEAGKATLEKCNCGYPNTYKALARDVLPLIENGPPPHRSFAILGDDYIQPEGWMGHMILHKDWMAVCPEDQMLIIEAFDLS